MRTHPGLLPSNEEPLIVQSRNVGRRNFLLGTGGSALALGLGGGLSAGCSTVSVAAPENGGELLQSLRDRGVVRMGFANEAPFGYINRQGELTGQAPTVAKAVFRRLGIDGFEHRLADFSSLIPALRVGLFDVIAAGMYIVPARCAEIEFTNPDYNAPHALLVRQGNPDNLRTVTDFAGPGSTRIGVITGGVEQEIAQGVGVPGNRLVIFPDQASGFDGVLAGRADAYMLSTLSLRTALAARPGAPLEITEPFIAEVDGVPQYGAGGFGFRAGETNMVEAFNTELADLKRSGRLLELVRPFGFTEDEMTDLTARELCRLPES
jgi:polar amino acid transport system substrate-binding protein